MVNIRNKIIMKDLNILKEYEKNNKNHPEEQISLLVQNIDKFGFTSPFLIDANNNLIAGHGRKLACDRLGINKVPCIVVDDLSEEEIKALRIADNRLGELGETNWINLKEEFIDLQDSGLNFLTGYEEKDFDFIEEDKKEVIEDDFEVPEDVEEIKTDIKQGDIIKLGNHRLMCGDSTSKEDVDKLVNNNKMHCVWTDPPWNVDYGSHTDTIRFKHRQIKNDALENDFKPFLDKIFSNYARVCLDGAIVYVVMSAQEWGTMMLSLKEFDFHWSSTIIWKKNSLVLSRKDYHTQYEPMWYGWKKGTRLCPLEDRSQSDVWDIDRPTRSDEHPTMKPIDLIVRSLNNSTDIHNKVIDLFGGSGSTLIACEQLDRKCYMMELDEKYCEVICQRWEKLTNNKRIKLN